MLPVDLHRRAGHAQLLLPFRGVGPHEINQGQVDLVRVVLIHLLQRRHSRRVAWIRYRHHAHDLHLRVLRPHCLGLAEWRAAGPPVSAGAACVGRPHGMGLRLQAEVDPDHRDQHDHQNGSDFLLER